MERTIKDATRKLSACWYLGCILSVATAHAAIDTWDGGGVDNSFKTAANWVGDVAPVPGDILTFDGANRLNPNNNFVSTQFGGLVFSATAAGPFTVTGNTLLLNVNITESDKSLT